MKEIIAGIGEILSMAIIILLGLFYAIYFLCIIHLDTAIRITYGASAVILSLAMLSFSCSKAILGQEEDRKKFQYAGEKLFCAFTMLIAASAIQYGDSVMYKLKFFEQVWITIIVSIILNITVFGMFVLALVIAIRGIKTNNELFWKRF